MDDSSESPEYFRQLQGSRLPLHKTSSYIIDHGHANQGITSDYVKDFTVSLPMNLIDEEI